MHTIATILVIILLIMYMYLYVSVAYKVGRVLETYHKNYYKIVNRYLILGVISGGVWLWSYDRIHEGMYKIIEILQLSAMALFYGIGLK
jgi:hypothetical protein